MSVNSYLSNTSSQLVLSEFEKNNIATSLSTLRRRLVSYFGNNIDNHFQFGSYSRGTILPRKADSDSDIDYMIVFDTSINGQKKPQTYLNRLRNFAETKYSTSEIFQSSPTIVLSLNHIKFELVPAINNYGYQIPSPSSSWSEWINTDPSESNKSLQNKNKAENYKIKPLVRLIKYWNAYNGHPFYSYSLEQYIIGKSFIFSSTLRDYFYSFWSDFNCPYDTAQYIKDKIARAKNNANEAKKYEDKPYTAVSKIKKVIPEL